MSTIPTVLIIEDDPVFRRVLSFTVAKSGLGVETACDGEMGFARLIRGGIDFIVTDLQMPVCGGVDLLRRLDELPNYTRPPAILCTAKGLELDSEQLRREFRLACIMHKPFSPRKLSEVILMHLNHGDEGRATNDESATAIIDPLPLGDSLNDQKPSVGFGCAVSMPVYPPQGCGDA